VWTEFDALLIVWATRFLSRAIRCGVASRLSTWRKRQAVLPVTRMTRPYVEYQFEGPRLAKVLQTREGDKTSPSGFSDVGTFLLRTRGLAEPGRTIWRKPRAVGATARSTSCRSFPFSRSGLDNDSTGSG